MVCLLDDGNCSQTIANQVGEVMSIMDKGAALVTGNIAIATTAGALASVVTFAIQVISKLVRVVITAWDSASKLTLQKSAFLMAMVRLVAISISHKFREDLISLRDKFGEFV